jgi:hypothetical protein
LERRSLQLYAALATAAGAGSVPLAQNYSAQVLNNLAAAITARSGTLPPPQLNYYAALLAHLEALVLAWGGDISGLPANFYGRSLGLLGRLNYDADVLAWFTAVEATGANFGPTGAAITTNKTAWSDFAIGSKLDGYWAKLEQLLFFSGISTVTGALVPFKGPAPTNFNFVQGDLNPLTGMLGNGVDKYLNLNRLSNIDPRDSNHMFVWAHTIGTSGSIKGARGGVASTDRWFSEATGNMNIASTNTLLDTVTIAGSIQPGLIGFSRTTGAEYLAVGGASNQQIVTRESLALTGGLQYFVFGRNLNGALFGPNNSRLKMDCSGTGMTASDVINFRARLTTLFNTLVWP